MAGRDAARGDEADPDHHGRRQPRRGHRGAAAALPDLDGHAHRLLRRGASLVGRTAGSAGVLIAPERCSCPTSRSSSPTPSAERTEGARPLPDASPTDLRHLGGPRRARRGTRDGLVVLTAVGSCNESSCAGPVSPVSGPRCEVPDDSPRGCPASSVTPDAVRVPAPAGSAADRRHRPVGLQERRVVDAVPGPLAAHRRPPSGRRSPRRSAPARSAVAQVGLLAGEQAVADLAVGGEPDPVAVAAERPGDRGDHADRGRAAVDQEQLGGGAPPRLLGRRRARTRASSGARISSAVTIVGRGASRAGRRAASAR